MSKNKTYAILGLGIFGSTIAKQLAKYNYEVIAIDKDIHCVERLDDTFIQAVRADFTDIDQLRSIGVKDCDVAVVASGSRLEESIMAVLNLKELGIPHILAKAKSRRYMEILTKIGADQVVRPDKEMGERVAKRLISQNIVDIIDLDDDYNIIEILAPKKWTGKALRDLDLRAQYGINIIGIRKAIHEPLSISPLADYVIEKEDYLLMIAENAQFDENMELFE